MRLCEQPKDFVEVVHDQEIQGQDVIVLTKVLEIDTTNVTGELTETDATPISTKVAETNTAIADRWLPQKLIPIADKATSTGDIEVTNPASTDPYLHSDGEFSGRPSD
ncbi:unnamed protein product [Vicia faba]|uniref:Uncharacterized protein n=1 Tax=Vicia faba TaxID=3906 RepID=A0AAV1A5J7_VICFA|nr:unnamed protein product [Vicia faba]